jgi:hypothetical protein
MESNFQSNYDYVLSDATHNDIVLINTCDCDVMALLQESVSPQVLGVVSECYKPSFRYFEPVSLFRRFIFVALSNVMRQLTNPSIRRGSLSLFIWIVLIMQVHLQPFLTNTENTLETSLLLNIAIVSAFSNDSLDHSTGYSIFILLSMIAALCQFLYATFKLKFSASYRDGKLSQSVRKNLTRQKQNIKNISIEMLTPSNANSTAHEISPN